MLISELIALLQKQLAAAGDVPVIVETGDEQLILTPESVVLLGDTVAIDLTAADDAESQEQDEIWDRLSRGD
jgi:hypothetical protein